MNKFALHALLLLLAGCAVIGGMLVMLHHLERQFDDLHLQPMAPKLTVTGYTYYAGGVTLHTTTPLPLCGTGAQWCVREEPRP